MGCTFLPLESAFMLQFTRCFGSRTANKGFQLLPDFKLKCGLEIHTQLSTQNKLFSLSTNDPFASANLPNHHTSFFDVSLPGSQPKLNPEVVLFATKLAVALNSKVNLNSHFDRKHYFYADQPMGYQITQHYSPFAKGGFLELLGSLDSIDENSKRIQLVQLQIEQDTGKSVYRGSEGRSLIDLNRSNVPLIELVTQPNFTDLKQIRAFIKKFQNLVRHLGISTGDLETGAMRVDVNLSVNGYSRVELKNLPNTSSILSAIKYEYQRQVGLIQSGEADKYLSSSETRGWTGSSTVKLRSKETTIDYRYMPDPELPSIKISPGTVQSVSQSMPKLPDAVLHDLMSEPYGLALKDAKILAIKGNGHDQLYTQTSLLKYYLDTFSCYSTLAGQQLNPRLPTNWIIHELLGNLNRLQLPLEKAAEAFPPKKFAELLMLIQDDKISKASGKLLLFHILNEINKLSLAQPVDLSALIEGFDLNVIKKIDANELREICTEIVGGISDPKLIEGIVSGKKKNSLKFLIGQGMRVSQGRIKPHLFEQAFKELLKVKW
ncbi:glutamyl-tRNA(Gln) amidotransferase subunit PET112 [Lachancea thermotolerans CBS 6340]|uniref:Glutamyl-tRNA(Gln) amidotransferase subunit B, mitochondrial n=1 Tax=Lachancea thermotolerans (strain ATCC 56472 / CBS 6340 / NRRL Y-8284) TaxID=559295 RepID=GATB_LACTC|nr:KLTH0C06402p [Lachancea thermotolerans CBS 6340]C5DE55.1 RecName: Full=Glutamyl-tRNA(Gln) amidotransferase subunit B, mitochondrial; Short=Glu-AdT subunit B [Lachancea thermotolerans CBS 6340]CAR22066.1 KLTH0C06402p [Lachancea thermotolerans CBS 6340]